MSQSAIPARRTLLTGMRLAALLVVASLFLSGCYYTAAKRYTDRTGAVPWWCQGPPDLTIEACKNLSANLDLALLNAHQYWTAGDLPAGTTIYGGSHLGGYAYRLPGDNTVFDPGQPNLLIYDEWFNDDARLVGIAWLIQPETLGAAPPEGFPGDRDQWFYTGIDGEWLLPAWVVRGYEYHPDIFHNDTHPCLEIDVNLTSTTDPCFVASHTVPLEVMVTNDDGYDAPGIDELVAGLTDDPNDPSDAFVAGINVQVVAPLTNQSGQGDNKTPGGAPAASPGLTTASGYPVLAAVHGTPADSVVWALRELSLSPDVVLSGINSGQNLASIGHLVSGTVGAARQARRWGVNAIATSSESGSPDWPASVAATLALLEQWRLGNAGVPLMRVPNINIPACSTGGSVRGTIETIVGEDLSSGNYFDPSNCFSTKDAADIVDDLDAYLNGFVGIADMGEFQPPNYP